MRVKGLKCRQVSSVLTLFVMPYSMLLLNCKLELELFNPSTLKSVVTWCSSAPLSGGGGETHILAFFFFFYPTNNGCLINFRLSSDAEILLNKCQLSILQVGTKRAKSVRNVCTFQLNYHFAYH